MCSTENLHRHIVKIMQVLDRDSNCLIEEFMPKESMLAWKLV